VTTGVISPDRAEFAALAGTQPLVAVTRRLLADTDTPVSVYRKLAGGPGTFLLESAENGAVWSRYSFVGVRCPATLTERDGLAHWLGEAPFADQPAGLDPLAALSDTLERLRTGKDAHDPPLMGGLVGYVSYDAVRRLERLPNLAVDDLHVPELALMLATDLAVLDHADGSVLLVANVLTGQLSGAALDAAYDDAVARLDAMTADLAAPTPPSVAAMADAEPVFRSRTPVGEHGKAVLRAVEEIHAGEAFQVVVAQRFETPTTAEPLDVYRVLRATNPSPYMYLLRFPDGVDVVGSSPEMHVKVTGRKVVLHPIAGTRWRGATPEEDARLAAELLADPKERAEHIMLVDLGRNDLGRVCTAGTVDVVDFFAVQRYSHVMHIESTVVGELAQGRTAFDALTATFPAGTLSGAPKPRAMEIIEELEPVRRGLYGGVVCYFDVGGDLDSAIAIRTALIRDGMAYVQAGGGIVADSDPDYEERETRNKARAVLLALARAETLHPPT
jgi:anthranilate synthase component I